MTPWPLRRIATITWWEATTSSHASAGRCSQRAYGNRFDLSAASAPLQATT